MAHLRSEELVPAATAAKVAQLPRLLVAAGLCAYTGNVVDALRHSELAMHLGASDIAATVYGSTTRYGSANRVKGLRQACADLEQIRTLRALPQTVGQ